MPRVATGSHRRSRNPRRRAVVLLAAAVVIALAVTVGVVQLSSATPGAIKSASSSSVTAAPNHVGHGHASPATKPPSPTTTAQAVTPAPRWMVAWGSPMALGYALTADATLRELTPVAIGGSQIRLRISNLYGNHPLALGAVTVGVATGSGAAVMPGSIQPVSFATGSGVTIPIGATVSSDPLAVVVHSGELLAVSLFVAQPDLVTLHPCCQGTPVSYATTNGAGDATTATTTAAFAYHSPWPALVDAIDVLRPSGPGSIMVIGDSITDGYHSTKRWTDVLQQRIDTLPSEQRRAVINEGITANTLTELPNDDARTGGGRPGVTRLKADALSQDGVSEVVLFLGTNDLWFGAPSSQVIAGMKQAIAAAHHVGIRIIGVTLLPRQTSAVELWTPAQQASLQQVNDWVLHAGAFDAVLDLAPVISDHYGGMCVPTDMYPPYDSGDHLHPNATGQVAMADSIDPTLLELPALPPVPQVPVVATAGCTPAA